MLNSVHNKTIALSALLADKLGGGVSTYIHHLAHHMPLISEDTHIILFVRQAMLSHFSGQPGIAGFPLAGSNAMLRLVQEWLRWPKLLKKYGVDLFHSPVSYIPPGVHVPAIFTLHDLRAFHFPETYTTWRLRFLQKIIPRSVAQASRIIAVSEYTRQDAIRLFNIPAQKIITIHEGIDSAKFSSPSDLCNMVRKKYDLPGRFILSVGHLEPRKNFGRLLRTLDVLNQHYHLQLPLVICGRQNWKYESLYKEIERLHLKDQVRLTGAVDEAELVALYQSAFVFVFPSLFEGFGFPPLESMAAGVPVLASSATSIPEVCGEAALYFDPLDEQDMAGCIARVIKDGNLYTHLVAKGKENIERFSWHRCAQQTMKVYKEVLKGG